MYQNYHKHSYGSNITVPDSVVSPEEYAQRAVELGHTLLSSVEHGWAGRYIEYYELAKQYNLKFLFGSEVYFVKDRLEKDRTNAHLVLLAKNENGRKAINRILSEANITGFYYRARIDLDLLLSLPKDDVWITTACVGGVWKYENYEEIILKIFEHFGNNFFLEVQNHNTDSQKELNKKIINLSNHYNIKIIFGVDSHYIYENQARDRDDYIFSKHISYEDEKGWYLDYPSDEIAFNRFVHQGILTTPQIEEAMKNTNIFLQVEEYTSEIFNKDMKLPTLYPDKTQEEKNDIFKNLISEKWNEEKTNIDQSLWGEYIQEIVKEVNVVIETGMADYFLLDYEIVKRSEELGGMLTKTGRGSIASFYTAKLLGFTTVDRISATVQLFPERFMTKERILDAKTLPDIDFNLGNPEVFAQAQIDIMGEGHSYPMLAYGTLQIKAAWKLYARAKEIDFEIANNISEEIGKFELAKKYNDEEQSPEDFISPEYLDYFLESKKYLGIVAQAGIHPCFVAGTKVLTKTGYKNIENITTDDKVWTHKAKYEKVLNTMSSISDDIYKFRIGGQIFNVTGNHLFYAQKSFWKYDSEIKRPRKFYETPEWISVENIYNHKNNPKNYKENYKIGSAINKNSVIPDFDGVPTHDKNFWWLVGKYIADGWTFKRKGMSDYRIIISFEKKQEEIDEFASYVKDIYSFYTAEERTVIKVYINNKDLFHFLHKFGKYAYGKFIPDFVLDLPIDLLKSFLKGYLTSDGMSFENGKITFSTVSNSLALGIQACSQKAFQKNCTVIKTRDYRTEFIEGRKVNCLPQWVGSISNDKSPRKQWCDGDYAWYNIDEIIPLDSDPAIVYNLEVKNDHSYNCGNIIAHNCAHILMQGNIKEEIGLINLKGHICACIDGLWAEKYGFLKNDLLKVSVVDLIYKTYEKLGRKPHSLPELIELCDNDEKVWDIYKNAQTIGINQFEGDSTRGRAAKYAPRNIAEASAFCSAIRPGFQSMYKVFENRDRFAYNVPTLDKLIQSKDIPYSFMLYQEQAMNVLAYAGIPIADTYSVIKNIAKKRYEKVFAYKNTFIDGMKSRLIDNENLDEDKATKVSNMTWQILEDSSGYIFNASHSYCVAGDSLYGAYLKANYPIQFYETILTLLEEDGDKDRLVRAIEEAEKAFKINFPRYRFGQDNRTIKGNVEKWEITTSLKSIKGFSSSVSDNLYELSQNKYDSFLDFLIDAEEKGCMSKKFEDLIQINYFEEFGSNLTLLKFFREFTKGKARYSKKHSDKTKEKRIELLKEFWKTLPDELFPIWQQLAIERDILGYIHAVYPYINKRFVFIMEINEKYSPRIQAYCLNNGKQSSLKIQKKVFENNNFLPGDIIYVNHFQEKPSISFVNGDFVESETETTWWIDDYKIISPKEFDEIVARVK